MKGLCLCAGARLICYRTVLNTQTAPRTQVHIDTARPFLDLYFKVPRRTLYGFQIGIGNKLDVQVPADLDQFR